MLICSVAAPISMPKYENLDEMYRHCCIRVPPRLVRFPNVNLHSDSKKKFHSVLKERVWFKQYGERTLSPHRGCAARHNSSIKRKIRDEREAGIKYFFEHYFSCTSHSKVPVWSAAPAILCLRPAQQHDPFASVWKCHGSRIIFGFSSRRLRLDRRDRNLRERG